MKILFEHPWWVTFWLLIIFDGISGIGKRIYNYNKENK
jgi:hypothetical protein